MKKKIDNPKVFISYAWGDEAYQKQVLAFASQLVSDGIDVVLDKWDLTEGNDTYTFMEKCATDPSITNVLMLLDPIYAKKADEHAGGVGTETQIISAKVYKEVTQDKFIPVVMKRDDDGAVCKPTYLEGRLHFDLSVPESYDVTYQRLVKTLFGEEIYAKPELGKKPKWVETPIVLPAKSTVVYESLKIISSSAARTDAFNVFLQDISNELIDYASPKQAVKKEHDDYLLLYDGSENIRNQYLQLLQFCPYIDNSQKSIADFLETTKNAISQYDCLSAETVEVRLHEIFIYTIAHYIKKKDYSAVGYLLGKTYFIRHRTYNESTARSFHLFYSGAKHQNLDEAVKARDGKRYYTGTGAHWIETLFTEYYTKEVFVLADLVCFNYSVYGSTYVDSWAWFPITYVYDNEYSSSIGDLGRRLSSKEFLNDVIPMFGYTTADQFIMKFKEIEAEPKRNYHDIRYPESFAPAGILSNFIKSDSLASLA